MTSSAAAATTLPAVAFVAANALGGSLSVAIVAAGLAALATFAWRLARREPLRQAAIGLVIAGVCAVVAAATGEARGFFLVPTLAPIAVVAVCAVSVLVRRPLTGVVLNRAAGGPARWYDDRRLRRVHTTATLVCTLVNVVNAALQVSFYLANAPAVLAAVHVATGPVFAAIVAATLVASRRVTHPRAAAPAAS